MSVSGYQSTGQVKLLNFNDIGLSVLCWQLAQDTKNLSSQGLNSQDEPRAEKPSEIRGKFESQAVSLAVYLRTIC
jgi:hypothetical protein